jgi:hypothetical protein
MRSYPRRVFKSEKEVRLVNDESEETKAASEGYESSYKAEIIAKRKGTDREILRSTSNESEPEQPELTRGQKAAQTRKLNKENNVRVSQ